MPDWAWAALIVVLVAAAAIALGGCRRGLDHPVVVAAAATASLLETGKPARDDRTYNNRKTPEYIALATACDAMEATFPTRAALRAAAPEIAELARLAGHDTLEPRLKACAAFHAEAYGDMATAYRLFFLAAIDSFFDREWAAQHATTPTALSDAMHYRTLAAILRLRAAGHATVIAHVGADKVTGYSCAQLRRDAPRYADCI